MRAVRSLLSEVGQYGISDLLLQDVQKLRGIV